MFKTNMNIWKYEINGNLELSVQKMSEKMKGETDPKN